MNSINNYLSKLRSPKILLIGGAIGILLIFISSFSGGNDKNNSKTENGTTITATEYQKQLEKEILSIVKDITGSRKSSVVVTLESGIRYSYADIKEETASNKEEKEKTSTDTQIKEGYITVKTKDDGEKALLITEQMPEIRGVAIVCEGGDNEILNEKIKNAVMAALNITSKRVYICGRQ